MIVPCPRLTRIVLLVLAPASLLAALIPSLALLPPILFGGLILLVLVDLLVGMGRLDELKLTAPAVVRTARGATFHADVVMTNPARGVRQCRLAVEWPDAVRANEEAIDVRLPPDDQPKTISIECRALSRGVFRVERCAIEASAPLGFFAFRRITPLAIEVRIYPDLTDEKKQAPAVFLSRGGLGSYAVRHLGKGREFETLREYVAGDTYSDIHWKATARRSRPVTKIFQVERTQEIYTVIDTSRLSRRRIGANRGVTHRMAGERLLEIQTVGDDSPEWKGEIERSEIVDFYIRAAMVLQLAAARQNDLFGLGTFSDRMEGFVRSGAGPAHLNLCRNLLFHQRARTVTPDFMDVFGVLRSKLRRRALIFLLTSLDDPGISDHFTRHIETLSSKHLVVVGMMRPEGVGPLFTEPVHSLSDVSRGLSGHIQWQKLRELEQVLRRKGVQFMLMDHARAAAQLIERYVQIKQRQLL